MNSFSFSKGKCLLAYGIAPLSNQQSKTSGILDNSVQVFGCFNFISSTKCLCISTS